MFTYNVGSVLARSIQDIMGRQNNFNSGNQYCTVYMFTGPVPEKFEDIPFDIDPANIQRNCIAVSFMDIAHSVNNGTEVRNVLLGSNRGGIVPIKRSAWDGRREKFRCAPQYIGRHNLTDVYAIENGDNYPEGWHGQSVDQSFLHGYQMYYGMQASINERRENSKLGMYGINWGSRYTVGSNHHQYFEYEQEVSIDAIELWQYADSRYTSDQISFEWWDPTLLSGAGDWVAIVKSGFNADKEFLWELDAPVVSTRFRVGAVNTGSGNWHIREISLLSDIAPFNVETVDVTWAIVSYGQDSIQTNPFYFNRTDSDTTLGDFPYILCDVGQPGDDALLILNQAKNVPGYFNQKILHFSLEFEEPQI